MFWKTKSKKPKGNRGSFTLLDPKAFKQAISSGNHQLVDVRTAREYKSGRIANAINIDLFRPGHFRAMFHQLDKEKPVYLYCRSGQRSQKAAQKLLNWGFTEIFDLEGGILNWNTE